MGSFATSISRTLCLRSSLSSRVFLPTAHIPTQVRCRSQPPLDAARRGVNEMANQSKDVAGKVAGAAENLAEKAKQTAQEAWNVAKETAQKVKENVSEKAEEAAEAVKENVDAAKRKMD